jgi:hypothetical protein
VSGWAAVGTVTPGGSPEEVKSLSNDIRWIHDSTVGLKKIKKPSYNSAAYPLSFLFPMFIAGIAILVRRRLNRLEGDVAGRRSRKAAKRALAALKEASDFYSSDAIADGYTALARGLIYYLADRTHNIAATLDNNKIATVLAYSNVPDKLIKRILGMLERCNTARFTPGGVDKKALGNLIEQSRTWILEVDKYLERLK